MDFDGLLDFVKKHSAQAEAPAADAGERFIIIPAADVLTVLKALKESPETHFDSLMCLSAADTGRELWVVYHLHSFKHLHRLNVKVLLPREEPKLDSVNGLWKAANFFEREAYDLYGIAFAGHPDLRRILNPPDWVGWPGRKDYEFPAEYGGVPTLRADQFFEEQIEKENAEREAATAAQLAAAKPASSDPNAAKGPA